MSRSGFIAALASAAMLSGVAAATPAAAQGTASASMIYVSPSGSDTAGSGGQSAPYQTIGKALSVAPAGATVVAEPGTYKASLSITKAVTLESSSGGGAAATTIIDATGHENALAIEGPGAAGTVIDGLTFENALKAGVVAIKTSGITIENSVVTNNDQSCTGFKACANPKSNNGIPHGVPGSNVPAGVQPLTPTNAIPCGTENGEDCEALHLMSVTNSTVKDNTVKGNLDGGIYLTDELGPSYGNTISGNKSLNNQVDCGITLASHNPKAAADPKAGGVYKNTVTGNTSDGNGAAGVVIAAAGPGMAAYDNTVKGNTFENNGETGIQLHSHAPHQNVGGNVISGNTVGGNGVDPDAKAMFKGQVAGSAGISVFSAVVPQTGIVIEDNTIKNEHYGIWMSPTIVSPTISGNTTDSSVSVAAFTAVSPAALAIAKKLGVTWPADLAAAKTLLPTLSAEWFQNPSQRAEIHMLAQAIRAAFAGGGPAGGYSRAYLLSNGYLKG